MKRALVLLALVAACGGGDAAAPDAGAPCDPATTPATCDGDSVIACTGGVLAPTDCTAAGQVCGDVGNGAECVSACVLAGVDATGTCTSGGIRRCENEQVVTTSCGDGNHCDASGGAPACVSDACEAIGPVGRCTGDTLTSCSTGALVETDCAASGQVCAYGASTGYACVAPGTVGGFVVDGVVRYEDKAPQLNGSLGPITQKVARGARVSVVRDSDSTVLAQSLTSDDGTYVLRYAAAGGEQVHVLAAAQNPTAARPIAVANGSNRVHGQAGASFAAAAHVTSDVLATDASGTSEAFNILDQITITMDMIRTELGDPTPTALTIRWYRGSNDGTYYSGSIHLLGANSDDDGYDDTVMLHESGHYVEDTEGRSDNPGGSHDGSPADPNLGWSEGFSTYLAMAVSGAPIYIDTNSGGGWSQNADTEVTTASFTGSIGQDVSENMVCEILWDLGDSDPGDDDGVALGHGEVLRVETDYLRSASLRNVGEPGVDLVDFLDGWFLAEGLAPCAPARTIVENVHHFPYDFAGPAGSCP